jgi:pimeloyl-ACP methyl ester carboxylesterase
MLTAADYQPPRWLRNPHLQSMLSSSRMRLQRGLLLLAATGAVSEEMILDGGEGVRLQGWHSHVEGREPRGIALLLHGWEGSAESSYMRMAAARMLEQGFDVVRLNFRDHGNTHHLNPGIFHSNLIDEVVHAAGDVAQRWPHLPLVAAGYSLGGNFVLRLALRAPAAGVPLLRVASVCPVLDPALTMESIENGQRRAGFAGRITGRLDLRRQVGHLVENGRRLADRRAPGGDTRVEGIDGIEREGRLFDRGGLSRDPSSELFEAGKGLFGIAELSGLDLELGEEGVGALGPVASGVEIGHGPREVAHLTLESGEMLLRGTEESEPGDEEHRSAPEEERPCVDLGGREGRRGGAVGIDDGHDCFSWNCER